MSWDALLGGVLAGLASAGIYAFVGAFLRDRRIRQLLGGRGGTYTVRRKLADALQPERLTITL